VRSTLESHLGSRQVARIVYGAIFGLALVVTAENHPPRATVMAAWLVVSGVTVAMAEVYSEVVRIETSERHRVTRQQFSHLLAQGWAVAFGVAFPAVFFLLAAVHLIHLDTAFVVARWTGLGVIGFYGYWAARFAGAPVPRALAQAAAVAAIGGLLIAFKALVH
jgi:hypothetical protein